MSVVPEKFAHLKGLPEWEAHFTRVAEHLAASPDEDIDPHIFITTQRLAADSARLVSLLPHDIDQVVAIPRSGLIPGGIVAAMLHVPLWSVIDDKVHWAGHGGRLQGREDRPARRVLLIDDTAALGREMTLRAPVVRAHWPDAELTRAVVYCHPSGRHAVDVYAAILPGSHYLEWNWANAGHGMGCGFDFDGVLCEECPVEDNDDGPRYQRFLREARPLHLPRRNRVPLIATGRHERYRPETLAWLDRHGVSVAHLVMRDWDCPDEEWIERMARWKAHHYTMSGLPLFAESEPAQAEIIARESGKPVLCPVAGRVFRPPIATAQPTTRPFDPAISRRIAECPHRRAGETGCGCHKCDGGTHDGNLVTYSQCHDCKA